jgi:hypothetical protein
MSKNKQFQKVRLTIGIEVDTLQTDPESAKWSARGSVQELLEFLNSDFSPVQQRMTCRLWMQEEGHPADHPAIKALRVLIRRLDNGDTIEPGWYEAETARKVLEEIDHASA